MVDDGFQDMLDGLKVEARKANKEDRDRVEAFRDLFRLDAWKFYQSLLDSRIQVMSERLLQPAAGIEGVLTSEYLKGAMYGLMLARNLPSVIVQSITSNLGSTDQEDD